MREGLIMRHLLVFAAVWFPLPICLITVLCFPVLLGLLPVCLLALLFVLLVAVTTVIDGLGHLPADPHTCCVIIMHGAIQCDNYLLPWR